MVRRTEEKTKVPGAGLSIPLSEIRFRFSRSGGAGGQHVNKVSTRVELLFDIAASSLTDEQKTRVLRVLAGRVDSSGVLVVSSDASRSQWKNREDALRRCALLLRGALAVRKKRVKTSITAGAKARRMQQKAATAKKKAERRRKDPDSGF